MQKIDVRFHVFGHGGAGWVALFAKQKNVAARNSNNAGNEITVGDGNRRIQIAATTVEIGLGRLGAGAGDATNAVASTAAVSSAYTRRQSALLPVLMLFVTATRSVGCPRRACTLICDALRSTFPVTSVSWASTPIDDPPRTPGTQSPMPDPCS
jgi:hypothetical protein